MGSGAWVLPDCGAAGGPTGGPALRRSLRPAPGRPGPTAPRLVRRPTLRVRMTSPTGCRWIPARVRVEFSGPRVIPANDPRARRAAENLRAHSARWPRSGRYAASSEPSAPCSRPVAAPPPSSPGCAGAANRPRATTDRRFARPHGSFPARARQKFPERIGPYSGPTAPVAIPWHPTSWRGNSAARFPAPGAGRRNGVHPRPSRCDQLPCRHLSAPRWRPVS